MILRYIFFQVWRFVRGTLLLTYYRYSMFFFWFIGTFENGDVASCIQLLLKYNYAIGAVKKLRWVSCWFLIFFTVHGCLPRFTSLTGCYR